jgi:two-component system, cell cycle sensor histidine kinase and response regulator CckA
MLTLFFLLASATVVYFALERRFLQRQARLLSLLDAALESVGDGIAVVNRQGRIVEFNHRFVEMWRLPGEIVRARDGYRGLAWILEQVKESQKILGQLKQISVNPESETRQLIELNDGRMFEGASRPQESQGAVLGRVWSFRDVTSERHLAEQLRRAQEMEAIGRLSGSIAHDLNNLLMVIKGYSAILAERLEPSGGLRKPVEEIGRATDRAAGLTRQLLSFGARQPAKLEWIDLNGVLRESEKLLGRLVGERIELVMTLDPALGRIRIDRGRLDQLLLNLAINARDAMPQGGRLAIETRRRTVEERLPGTRAEALTVLTVGDTGIGMDAETRARLFEPFFTTKKPHGTGLGLATVYAIVAENRGQISVESEAGCGTSFRISFPEAGEPAEDTNADGMPAGPLRGSETVLVAEMDEGVRRLVGEFLRERGYLVLEAASGSEALELGARYAGTIDLLLASAMLAGMTGSDLAGRLSRLRPRLRVVFMSEYAPATMEGAAPAGREAPCLQKPFDMTALAMKVREALGASRAKEKAAGAS